jgi:hypothetical protein
VLDGAGGELLGQIGSVSRSAVTVQVRERLRRPPRAGGMRTLIQAVAKTKAMDGLLQKNPSNWAPPASCRSWPSAASASPMMPTTSGTNGRPS